jgi:branched-chain amino acid transport system ATP-binding protein
MAEEGAIKVEDLVVERGGKPVLHGVSLEVRPGEITALVGANGAGKSTLVMTLAGLLPAARGKASFDGRPFLGEAPDRIRRAGIAVVPEGHQVLSDLSVRDNLRAAGSMHPRRRLEEEIEAALQLFPELRARLDVPGRALSGGQKQMLALSQAVIARPRMLLIDELSLGLAPTVVKRLAGTLPLIARGGVGVLLIEQFTTLALSLASEAYVLERGRIVFSGSAVELAAKPEILHSAYLAGGAAGPSRAKS